MWIDFRNFELDVRLAMAAADYTSGDILAQLAEDLDSKVRCLVAGNPNTPVEILHKLGEEFPDAVTANPIFNILLLKDPDSKFVRLSLARSQTTSEDILARLAETDELEDENILCAIASNLNTPIYILEKLLDWSPKFPQYCEYEQEFSNNYVCVCIASNLKVSLTFLERLANHESCDVREAVAQNINTSSEILDELASDLVVTVLREVAKNQNTSTSALEQLAGEKDKQIRDAVMKHPNASDTALDLVRFMEEKSATPIYILEKLASDRRLHVRQLVADHPFTPSQVLEKLSQERDFTILDCVICHQNTSSQVLEKLTDRLIEEYTTGKDSHRFDRGNKIKLFLSLINNPRLTSQALLKIANLETPKTIQIKKAIAKLSTAPSNALLKISEYEGRYVNLELYKDLIGNSNTPSEAIDKLFWFFITSRYWDAFSYLCPIVTHTNIPVQLLEEIVSAEEEDSTSFKIRHQISISKCQKRGFFPSFNKIDILKTSSTISDWSTRIIQVGIFGYKLNLSTFKDYKKPDPKKSKFKKLRIEVAKNPVTPVQILQKLAEDSNDKIYYALAQNINTPIDILLDFLVSPSWGIRAALASNIKAPINNLKTLANDEDPNVRANIARNINTPILILESLAKDDENVVRENITHNQQTPAYILELLLNNSTKTIQENIAKHPLTSLEILLKLAENENTNVRKAIIKIIQIPELVLEKIIQTTIQQIQKNIEIQNNQAQNEFSIFWSIAEHPDTPAHILEKLAFNLYDETGGSRRSVFDRIQQAVAENINSSVSILEKLTDISSVEIRKAAKKTLKAKRERY